MTSTKSISGTRGPARRGLAAVLGLALTLATGCAGVKSLLAPQVPPATAHHIWTTWQPKVVPLVSPNGTTMPGLAGRLYLFDEQDPHPLTEDGSVVVDLFDDTPAATGGQPKLLEKWVLDKDTLKKLLRRDMIGQGYTLFLPWGTFKSEISQIHLMVAYTPPKGNPLYSPSTPITLNKGSAGVVQVTSQTVAPAAAPAIAPEAHSRYIVPNPGTREPPAQPQPPGNLNVQRLTAGSATIN
jgi:hypothetical protein